MQLERTEESVAPNVLKLVEKMLRRRTSGNQEKVEAAMFRASIYTSGEEIAELSKAVDDLIGALGYEVIEKLPPEKGSWFQRMKLRMSSGAPPSDLVKGLERALKLQTVTSEGADIDPTQIDAVSALLKAMEATDNSVVQIGSLLLVKYGGKVAVRTLSQREIEHLSRAPQLLRSPAEILNYLQKSGAEAQIEED